VRRVVSYMAMRLFLVYVLVELAVVVALVSTIGFGWTFLLVVGTFALGLALAGSQLKRQLQRLRSGLRSPQGAASDGALVALGTVLTVVPGLVTSALGLLLLLPPTRAVARPAVTALAARSLGRMPVIITTAGARTGRGAYVDGEVIDGEVIDVTDVRPPSLPPHPDRHPDVA
jgi:UPF0716 protein FxsA